MVNSLTLCLQIFLTKPRNSRSGLKKFQVLQIYTRMNFECNLFIVHKKDNGSIKSAEEALQENLFQEEKKKRKMDRLFTVRLFVKQNISFENTVSSQKRENMPNVTMSSHFKKHPSHFKFFFFTFSRQTYLWGAFLCFQL